MSRKPTAEEEARFRKESAERYAAGPGSTDISPEELAAIHEHVASLRARDALNAAAEKRGA